MTGAVMASAAGGRFIGALGVGNDGVITNYGYVVSVYGTLAPLTFVDTAGTTRTIRIWNWNNTGAGTVGFRLNGTSISNTDTTFIAVIINGTKLLRSAATYTADDGGGRTLWSWSTNTSAYPTSGTVTAVVQ